MSSKRVTRRAVLHYFNSFIYKYLLKFQKSFFTEIYSKTSGKPRKQAFFYSKNHGITIAGRSIGALPIILKSRRRSEEHTSELQSRENIVCRLLLEKKTTERCGK